jgi:hypothetical protein
MIKPLSDEAIKNIVMLQALAKHGRGFLKYYDMDDGVESGKTIAQEAERYRTEQIVELLEKNKDDKLGYDWGQRQGAPIVVITLDPIIWQKLKKAGGLNEDS